MSKSYYELIGKIVQLDIENSTGRISWKGGHTEVLFACGTKTLTEAFCKHELSLFEFDYDSEDNMIVRNIEEVEI
jgi:hypothetical protein